MRRLNPGARLTALALALCGSLAPARAAEVSGRVMMTDLCSPGVSPAVVFLSPSAGRPFAAPPPAAAPRVIRQNGILFEPRIQALAPGQGVRFEDQDGEAHRISIRDPDAPDAALLAPDAAGVFVPPRPGVYQVECGLHLHKRGFLIVSPSPWFQACTEQGDYRLRDVPPGRYVLTAWHEMGEPQRQDIDVPADRPLAVPRVVLSAPMSLGTLVRKDIQLATDVEAPIRPWKEPLDQISVLLSAARGAVGPSREVRKAQRLLEDAYWGEFEASDLESAIRIHLGNGRAAALAGEFGDLRRALAQVGDGRREPATFSDLTRELLFALGDAVRELNALGVLDNRPIGDARDAAKASKSPAPSTVESRAFALQALKRALHRVQYHADRSVPEEAASALTSVLLSAASPLSIELLGRRPTFAWRLEHEFNALEGELAGGLKGDELADRVERIEAEIDAVHGELPDRATGAFGPPFVAGTTLALAGGIVAALVLPIVIVAGRQRTALPWLALAVGLGIASALSLRAQEIATAGSRYALDGWMGLLLCGLIFQAGRRVLWLSSQPEGSKPGLRLAGLLTSYKAAFDLTLTFVLVLDASGPSERISAVSGGLAGLVLLGWIGWIVARSRGWVGPRAWGLLAGFGLFALAAVAGSLGLFALQQVGTVGVTPTSWPGGTTSVEVLLVQLAVLVAGILCGFRAIRDARTRLVAAEADASLLLPGDPKEHPRPAMTPVATESYAGPRTI